jgi:hypothetical protein
MNALDRLTHLAKETMRNGKNADHVQGIENIEHSAR